MELRREQYPRTLYSANYWLPCRQYPSSVGILLFVLSKVLPFKLGIKEIMNLLKTAQFCAKAPHSKKFARMAKTALESYRLFCALKQCYCENSLCACSGNCDRNADPLSHIAYLGLGNVCDRCCAAMPAEYHLNSCNCETCTTTIDGILRGKFRLAYHEGMDWVSDDKRANVRLRIARCHESTGPDWNDDSDGGYHGPYLDLEG